MRFHALSDKRGLAHQSHHRLPHLPLWLGQGQSIILRVAAYLPLMESGVRRHYDTPLHP